MIQSVTATPSLSFSAPALPVLWVGGGAIHCLTEQGEVFQHTLHSYSAIRKQYADRSFLVCHAPYTFSKLNWKEARALDLLELFAFTHPGKFVSPTPAGLARGLGLDVPQTHADYCFAMMECSAVLLENIAAATGQMRADMIALARFMRGWSWRDLVLQALSEDDASVSDAPNPVGPLLRRLPELAETPPPSPVSFDPIMEDEVLERLRKSLDAGQEMAENRTDQRHYALSIMPAFAPPDPAKPPPRAVMAQAGTGIGKTLGYLAPASVWADKNRAPVWVSTYTRNLQRQIDRELERLYPDPETRVRFSATRKGRENYICLLNYADMAQTSPFAVNPQQIVAAGILARWISVSEDGDMTGRHFPGWLRGILGNSIVGNLADRRGECLYSACEHYHRCFIERSVRKSRHARIVVANHALSLINAARGAADDMPAQYIFDEAHHLYDAADSVFSVHFTARETYELRRWLIGPEGGRKSRARGLKRRIGDLLSGDAAMTALLDEIVAKARTLTRAEYVMEGDASKHTLEKLWDALASVIAVRAKSDDDYVRECRARDFPPEMDVLLEKTKRDLQELAQLGIRLRSGLKIMLEKNADTLSSDTRNRIMSVLESLDLRMTSPCIAWVQLIEDIAAHRVDPAFVDRAEHYPSAQVQHIGIIRHPLDPTAPMMASLRGHSAGLVMTSATLKGSEDANGWIAANAMTGVYHLDDPGVRQSFPSPFDYGTATRVFIVNDVDRNDMKMLAAAYRVLFTASQGGALGLFTAIKRLLSVHAYLQPDLEKAGYTLFAQHADQLDTGTLIDLFRDDPHACLLGTDALRDGVDVPGESLRLVVMDRVPWPRANLLHKARREYYTDFDYDDYLVRLRLKQAFGRLIRRHNDFGVFVLLEKQMPGRFLDAFPDTAPVVRCGLAEATAQIKDFFKTKYGIVSTP